MNKLLNVLIVVLIAGGLALLLYPSVSDFINSKHSAAEISRYNEIYVNTDIAKRGQMIERAEQYNDYLKEGKASFFDPSGVPGYNDTLNITGTGIMGYIDIDKIGVELPVYHGVDDGVLQIGVGHIEGSSLPVGGQGTHCVLSGHRGLPTARLFTDLDRMEIGDRFRITVLDRVVTYEVDQIRTVLPEDVSELAIEDGKDYCTLVTCTPYGINTHRLLVRGIRVENAKNTPGIFVSGEAFKVNSITVATVMAIPAFIAIVVITVVIERRKEHGKKK